jgi:hypothetical protein
MRRLARLGAACITLVACAAAPATGAAQELEPRAYTNTPVGVNFLIAGYAYQQGDVVTDAGLPLENGNVHAHTALLAYARAFSVLGTSAKADVIVPFSWAAGSADVQGAERDRAVNGFNDPRFRLAVNLYGAPAITVAELPDYDQDLIIGASFQFAAPLGQYDGKKLLNIGTNRWAFKQELGISKALGPMIFEVAPSITFFTDNDDFFGGHRREQDPIYAVQSHVVYRWGQAFWAALDGTYYGGGRTTTDGVAQDNRQSNARLGGTLALSVSRHHSVKLFASKAVATRFGGDFDVIGMALQYRWGGGL